MSETPNELPEGKGPGHWQRTLLGEGDANPVWSALIWCPSCGRPLMLQRGHHIAPDGQITPSVGHPNSYPPCGWHTSPRLLGWAERPTPAPRPAETCARCGRVSRTLGGWGTHGGFSGIVCDTCVATLSEPHHD